MKPRRDKATKPAELADIPAPTLEKTVMPDIWKMASEMKPDYDDEDFDLGGDD